MHGALAQARAIQVAASSLWAVHERRLLPGGGHGTMLRHDGAAQRDRQLSDNCAPHSCIAVRRAMLCRGVYSGLYIKFGCMRYTWTRIASRPSIAIQRYTAPYTDTLNTTSATPLWAVRAVVAWCRSRETPCEGTRIARTIHSASQRDAVHPL